MLRKLTREASPYAVSLPQMFRGMSETPTTTTSQKVLQYTSDSYCNTPPICISVLSVCLSSEEMKILAVLLHLCRSSSPVCIAIRLPFVWLYFWESAGGWGHRDVCQQCSANIGRCGDNLSCCSDLNSGK